MFEKRLFTITYVARRREIAICHELFTIRSMQSTA